MSFTIIQPQELLRSLISGTLITAWLVVRTKFILKEARISILNPQKIKETKAASKTASRKLDCVRGRSILGRWRSGYAYLLYAPDIISENYKRDVPFAVPTPETHYVHVSSSLHVKELLEAPEDKLSLHAVSRDMLQPKYTMNGLEVRDIMSENGSLHSRVLRIVLPKHLSELQPRMFDSLCASFRKEIAAGASASAPALEGWVNLQIFGTAKNLVRTVNSTVFFGEELATNSEFLDAALQYPEDLLWTSEILRFIPTVLCPIAAPILMRRYRGIRTMRNHLLPIIRDRLENPSPTGSKPQDCVQWIIDTNPRKDPWSSEKILQVILGLWFASVHQLAITLVYALDDLCEQKQHIEILREELRQHNQHGESSIHFDSLPLLDSFLKESARLHPSDSISVRRKALAPFTFSDGLKVLPGEVLCMPMRAMMRDSQNFTDGDSFNGTRFFSESNAPESRYVHGDTNFPFWGLGRRACPGRYYAVHALKMIVAHVLLNYDVRMSPGTESQRRTFHWRSSTVPLSCTTLEFRRHLA